MAWRTKYKEQLKPCPFCGDTGGLALDTNASETIVRVRCGHCGATIARAISPYLDTAQSAVDAWNRRASDGE